MTSTWLIQNRAKFRAHQHIVKLTGNTNLKHVSDLLGVDVEVLARVDGDDGGAGKCLDEVIDISLPQSVQN